jgi:hypothetical protein
MKSDLYTKFVLTVIALSLSVIAIQLTTKEAHAQSGMRFSPTGALVVTICDFRYGSCAEITPSSRLKVEEK